MDISDLSLEYYILNEDGNPKIATYEEWIEWHQAPGNRTVAKDNIGDVLVSTVFVSFGFPVFFETMIFGGEHDETQLRYDTRAEAIQGHKDAVYKVEQTSIVVDWGRDGF